MSRDCFPLFPTNPSRLRFKVRRVQGLRVDGLGFRVLVGGLALSF